VERIGSLLFCRVTSRILGRKASGKEGGDCDCITLKRTDHGCTVTFIHWESGSSLELIG
jgi:hypothetical protein